jgi:hypothetical protein
VRLANTQKRLHPLKANSFSLHKVVAVFRIQRRSRLENLYVYFGIDTATLPFGRSLAPTPSSLGDPESQRQPLRELKLTVGQQSCSGGAGMGYV